MAGHLNVIEKDAGPNFFFMAVPKRQKSRLFQHFEQKTRSSGGAVCAHEDTREKMVAKIKID